MKTKDRNMQSYLAIVDSFLQKAECDPEEHRLLSTELKRYLTVKFEKKKYVHPLITKFCTDWYREFYRLIGHKDPYKKLKDKSNQEAAKVLKSLKCSSFLDAVKISLKGNMLDFGAILVYNPDLENLSEEFKKIDNVILKIDHTKELQEAICNAKKILFLADNAGEIILDIPLLENIRKLNPNSTIYIGAKETPMLNDVTVGELKEMGFDKYGIIVSTGSNCFGLHEEDVSMEFKKHLKDADLIIAKGQSYLEFFTEYNFSNVFNIARIKYPVINNAFGTLEPHQNIVLWSRHYAHTGEPYNFGISELKEEIDAAIKKQKGIIFAVPAIVSRETYSGRDIIAKNSRFEHGYADERGYVPVEWWIMSITKADNEKKKENEGITNIKINEKEVFLTDAISACENLLGDCRERWPLTKILDIGGQSVSTSISEEPEVPPIPLHVHSGYVKNKKINGAGKLEAYFFPPLNVPPHNRNLGKVETRLGLKQNVTKEQLLEAMKKFGNSDDIYKLCNIYEIKEYDGWTIPPGTIHAPGPWVTFEIQSPQDDFNLIGWQLGKRILPNELEKQKQSLMLKGLDNEDDVIAQAISWESSTDPKFKENYYRPSKVVEEGRWGRRLQIFFDNFYGEGFEIKRGETYKRNADERPFAGIVWSGKGEINGNVIDAAGQKEFLATPNTDVEIKNNGETPLLIYTVFPIKNR